MNNKAALYARDLTDLQWRKSSRSHDDDPPDNCVEVASFPDGIVAVRDSNNPGRPTLMFTAGEWAAFTFGVRNKRVLARCRSGTCGPTTTATPTPVWSTPTPR